MVANRSYDSFGFADLYFIWILYGTYPVFLERGTHTVPVKSFRSLAKSDKS